MGDTREVRTFASEVKFVVQPDLADGIRRWARAHLDADPHGGGPFSDQYLTNSIYFDTERHDVFHRRGSFGRSKYRVRRYGADEMVFLERKLREPSVLAKRRTITPLASLEHVGAAVNGRAWAGRWFDQRVTARRLRPVCQVAYHRTARMTVSGSDVLRLTLDDSLAARTTSEVRFGDDEFVAVLPGHAILELKFRHAIPAIFKRLVEEFGLTPRPASKYRLGMVAVGAFPEAALYAASENRPDASASYV